MQIYYFGNMIQPARRESQLIIMASWPSADSKDTVYEDTFTLEFRSGMAVDI